MESIQQAIADEAAVRQSANIVPSSTATNSLIFVKRHPPSKKDMKTDKPRHTANFRFHANLKSSANSKSMYTCYSCGHAGHRGMIASSAIVFAINARKKDILLVYAILLKCATL